MPTRLKPQRWKIKPSQRIVDADHPRSRKLRYARPPGFTEWHLANPSLSYQLAMAHARRRLIALNTPCEPERRERLEAFHQWARANPELALTWAPFAHMEFINRRTASHQHIVRTLDSCILKKSEALVSFIQALLASMTVVPILFLANSLI